MSTVTFSLSRPDPHRQTGATLLIAVVFLLIITLLSISSMRGVALESRITANLKQQKTLMNAAEAGLRWGENSIGGARAPTLARTCSANSCLPWQLSDLTTTAYADTPSRFAASNAANVATVVNGYDSKIQWYVVQLGPLGVSSQNADVTRGKGVWFYEVNACASSVLCTSDTSTRRVILRSVIARSY